MADQEEIQRLRGILLHRQAQYVILEEFLWGLVEDLERLERELAQLEARDSRPRISLRLIKFYKGLLRRQQESRF
ncbi:hypothetical protein CBOM_01925 [Ceraceosorus bombacis]|uniref:Uncharacterized protein n=1 Tax=Ceraceosorus bombacis TaxID=401625 RepID=A0A0P1BD62_9BASI|nr:hypothetical protein CBOM_01925 [Ceraceosorus bombacis]